MTCWVRPPAAAAASCRNRCVRSARSGAASSCCCESGGKPVPELRDYGVGAQILVDLGVREMILLTTTHRTIVGLEGYGLTVVEERLIGPGGLAQPAASAGP